MKINILKQSIKSLFLILMLLVIALTFSACAQVRVMTITNDDDTIEEVVTITINPEELDEYGYSYIKLKTNIEENSLSQAQQMANKLNDKINIDLLMVRDKESIDILNSYKDGIDVIKSDWKENTYAIGIKFKNIDVYKYYYQINDNLKTKTYTEKHFFYNKIYYYASTMYVKHHDLYDKVNAYYSAQYPELIESESNELLYTYKTDIRRQHSDADYITKQDGEYYHTWIVDANNIEKPIMLYYNIANPENWIILSMCITLGVSVVLSIIVVISNLLKKGSNQNDIKKEDN